MNTSEPSASKPLNKYTKPHTNPLLIRTKGILNSRPSKAKLQTLKWKYSTRRQSLPSELNDSYNEIFSSNYDSVKRARRKTESDLELDVTNFNISTLETEIHKRRVHDSRKRRKCRKLKRQTTSELIQSSRTLKRRIEELGLDNINVDFDVFSSSRNFLEKILQLVLDLSHRIKLEISGEFAGEKETDFFVSQNDILQLRAMVRKSDGKISLEKFNEYISVTLDGQVVTNAEKTGLSKRRANKTISGSVAADNSFITIDKASNILAFMRIHSIHRAKNRNINFDPLSYFDYIIANYFRKKDTNNVAQTRLWTSSPKSKEPKLVGHEKICINDTTNGDNVSETKKSDETFSISDDGFLKYYRSLSLNESDSGDSLSTEDLCLKYFKAKKEADAGLLALYSHQIPMECKKHTKSTNRDANSAIINVEQISVPKKKTEPATIMMLVESDDEDMFIPKRAKLKENTVLSNIKDANYERDLDKPKPKVNAFALMMDARHRTIGSNSPGIDPSPQQNLNPIEKLEKKRILDKRKQELSQWAEKKGAGKRRLQNEAEGEYIEKQLQKRAKKLKILLTTSPSKSIDAPVSKIMLTKSSKRQCITTEINSKDIVEDPIKNTDNLTHKVTVIKPDSNKITEPTLIHQDKVLIKNSEVARQGEVFKKTFGESKKTNVTSPQINDNLKSKLDNVQESTTSLKSARKIRQRKLSLKSDSTKENNDIIILNDSTDSIYGEMDSIPKERSPIPKSDNTNYIDTSVKRWSLRLRTPKSYLDLVNGNEDTNKAVKNGDANEAIFTPTSKKKTIKAGKKNEKLKSAIKLAPLFQQKVTIPKPLLDPAAVEAKMNFLRSGIPSTGLKLTEKQKCIEDYDCEVFPTISHVFQKPKEGDLLYSLWNLTKPIPPRNMREDENSKIELTSDLNLTGLINVAEKLHVGQSTIPLRVSKLDVKNHLKQIKTCKPTFPVNSMYRRIRTKSQPTSEQVNRNSDFDVISAMWTEKYKPETSSDIIGNSTCIRELKLWLQNWQNCNHIKRSQSPVNSPEAREVFSFGGCDSDSRDSSDQPRNNTLVLVGPVGTGKTTTVYAIANELGFSILEINASSQRNGKIVLKNIQEATQSHRVYKNVSTVPNGDFSDAGSSYSSDKSSEGNSKFSLILVEDIDIVFAVADEGFLNAVNTLISSSKRPVVITSSDMKSPHTLKYMAMYKTLKFRSLSPTLLAPWLQLVGLVEGVYLPEDLVCKLLDYNGGDVRCTLLQLQFWIQSGDSHLFFSEKSKSNRCIDAAITSNTPNNSSDPNKLPPFKDLDTLLFKYFVAMRDVGSLNIAYPIQLKHVWWNLGAQFNVLDMKSPKHDPHPDTSNYNLESVSNMYDCLAFTDLVNTKNQIEPENNLAQSTWKSNYTKLSNSLSLRENKSSSSACQRALFDLTHWLVGNSLHAARNSSEIDQNTEFDWGKPTIDENRSHMTMAATDNLLLDAVAMTAYLSPNGLAVDYFPTLRAINRSECLRAENTKKRGNRFYHYLRSLNMNPSEVQSGLINKIFAEEAV